VSLNFLFSKYNSGSIKRTEENKMNSFDRETKARTLLLFCLCESKEKVRPTFRTMIISVLTVQQFLKYWICILKHYLVNIANVHCWEEERLYTELQRFVLFIVLVFHCIIFLDSNRDSRFEEPDSLTSPYARALLRNKRRIHDIIARVVTRLRNGKLRKQTRLKKYHVASDTL